MPPSVKYFSKAVEIQTQKWSASDVIWDEFNSVGHHADFLNIIVSKKKKLRIKFNLGLALISLKATLDQVIHTSIALSQ